MQKLLCFVFLATSVALTGCATNMEPPFDHPTYQSKPWKFRKQTQAGTTSWKIQGAMSIRNKDKAQMGSFTWEQIQNRFAINFFGPLNIGAVGITGVPGRVTLVKPTGSFSAPSAEELMQQQLGWYLPVSNMYYWIRGIPAPGAKGQEQHDEYGHLVSLQQQGWSIQFAAYQPQDQTDLPRKIVMSNQQLHVKLVINNWQLHD